MTNRTDGFTFSFSGMLLSNKAILNYSLLSKAFSKSMNSSWSGELNSTHCSTMIRRMLMRRRAESNLPSVDEAILFPYHPQEDVISLGAYYCGCKAYQ